VEGMAWPKWLRRRLSAGELNQILALLPRT
jgi:hypothetical protein